MTPPVGVQASPCPASPTQSEPLAQAASSPSSFVAPGDGEITGWETNQTGNTAPGGEQVGLLVLRNTGANYQVVGTDLETLPATLPSTGTVTFQIANPIKVKAGDLLGLFSPPAPSSPLCIFQSTALGTADAILGFGLLSGAPTPGQLLPPISPIAAPDLILDVAATFVPNQDDAGVSTAAGPANAVVGEPALLSSTVTNGNVDNVLVTLTDAPAGLTIDSAVAGSGACSTGGQIVTCTVSGLAPGQSAPVQIVVTPAAAGVYQNAVSIAVASSATDPNAANNAASAALSVAPAPSAGTASTAAPVAHCVVPALGRIPATFARRVLGLLGCRVGSVRQVHSKNVAKGEVIRSTPGAGTYPAARVVSLVVSSGRAKLHR